MAGTKNTYTVADRKFAYELWYNLGRCSINALQRELKRLHKESKTPFVAVPTVATLAVWKTQYWDEMAKERDTLVEVSLTNDAVKLQNDIYSALSYLAIQSLQAQKIIIDRAKLEELKPGEARILLSEAGMLSKNALEQFKQAMAIAGLADQYSTEKKPLAEIIAMIDRVTAGGGDNVRTLLAAKISSD